METFLEIVGGVLTVILILDILYDIHMLLSIKNKKPYVHNLRHLQTLKVLLGVLIAYIIYTDLVSHTEIGSSIRVIFYLGLVTYFVGDSSVRGRVLRNDPRFLDIS